MLNGAVPLVGNEKGRTFAAGKVLHGQLPENPPGLDRSKGIGLTRRDVVSFPFFCVHTITLTPNIFFIE